MAPSLRTISILMLLAGVSMGVFAGTLMADDPVPQLGTHKAGAAAGDIDPSDVTEEAIQELSRRLPGCDIAW